MNEKTERERELEIHQKALEMSSKLEALQMQPEWSVIDKVLTSLVSEFGNELINGDILPEKEYIALKSKLDGVRAVSSRFSSIISKGKQARESLKVLDE